MEFTNTEVWGFKHALHGMRNAMESWDKSDSKDIVFDKVNKEYLNKFEIGENDMKLCKLLIKAGAADSKFLRMIHVSVDVNMPRYWWSEQDTYHFGTKNSCSTMHKLLNNKNEITLNQFEYCEEDINMMSVIVDELEKMRKQFKESQNNDEKNRLLLRAKRLLPEGFLQMRTWDTNYAELRNMYFQRVKHPHRLKEEWVDIFGGWIQTLPYSKELITGEY